MKIDINIDEQLYTVDQLNGGEIFFYENNYYMVCEDHQNIGLPQNDEETICTNIENGQLSIFDHEVKIWYVPNVNVNN